MSRSYSNNFTTIRGSHPISNNNFSPGLHRARPKIGMGTPGDYSFNELGRSNDPFAGQVVCWNRQDNAGHHYTTCADVGPPQRQLRRGEGRTDFSKIKFPKPKILF